MSLIQKPLGTTLLLASLLFFNTTTNALDDKGAPPEVDFTKKRSPEEWKNKLDEIEKSGDSTGVTWWLHYHRGLLDAQQENYSSACSHFSAIASDENFPLKDIAYLRAFEYCPNFDKTGLSNFDKYKFPDWMSKTVLKAQLDRARRSGNKRDIMQLAIEKSKEYLPRTKKTGLVQEAIQIAQSLGDKKNTLRYQKRLYKIAPRFNPNPRFSQFMSVAQDHLRARNFDKARKYYWKVYKSNSASFLNKLKALKGIRKAFKVERELDHYLQATHDLAYFVERYYRKRPDSSYRIRQHHKAQVTLMRTLWTQNQVTNAKKVLNKLTRQLKGKHPLHEVYWLYGRMSEEKQKFAEAVGWFDKALSEIPKGHHFREDLLWYKVWNHRKLNQWQAAISGLEELSKISENPFSLAKYRFWLAYTLKKSDKKPSAEPILKELIAEDPIGFYGLLAQRELNGKISGLIEVEQKNRKIASDLSEPLRKLVNPPLVQWMIACKEYDLTKSYLNTVAEKFRRQDNVAEEDWLGLFNLYARAGSYLSLFEQLGKLPGDQRDSLLSHSPEIIFPMPFRTIVDAAASRFSVAPELIYAIMRQESAFNPRARSPVDAFGLMQILPKKAWGIAKATGTDMQEAEDLFFPEINIPIGVSHVRDLLNKYKNQFILAVASYNASDEALRGWLKTRYRGDSLEFIEDIPYEETRGYVRLVMRNMIFYTLLRANGEAIEFPDWALELKPEAILSQKGA